VQADQAIFTSLTRRGKSGYHLVSRSAGVTEGEAGALARWCPSHGALIVDGSNRASVNFHPMPGGRFALSRTCEGRPEYSGRGGRQVYTHVLLFDAAKLRQSGYRPFVIYRDALALGYFQYRPDPDPVLGPAPLSSVYPRREAAAWSVTARGLGLPVFDSVVTQVQAGQGVVLPYDGDRVALAESLVDQLDPETLMTTSFATSLHPSSVRPYLLNLVGPGG
jgi:hypothetical protein